MQKELALRLAVFFGVFIIMALWEVIAPKRKLTVSKAERWFNNLSIIVIDNLLLYLLAPAIAITTAFAVQRAGWGLLNYLHMSFWPSVIISVLFLDMVIYLQHLMFHAVPLLWRFHMMHHADLDIDVTTGLRFHPVEILISMGIKIAAISVIGAPVLAVLIFEIVLNGTSMFNHSNVRMPYNMDRLLRLLVVTPDMHRVHHSVTIRETNSNFGFNFPWWDRIFGTYRAQPAAGHQGMTIGLAQYRHRSQVTLPRLLVLPFVGNPGFYSINKSGREPVRTNRLR